MDLKSLFSQSKNLEIYGMISILHSSIQANNIIVNQLLLFSINLFIDLKVIKSEPSQQQSECIIREILIIYLSLKQITAYLHYTQQATNMSFRNQMGIVEFELNNTIHKLPFFQGTNLIGRNPNKTNICIRDTSISQIHAKLICKDNKIKIVDNKSKNGIYVNSLEHQLQVNEEVEINWEKDNVYISNIQIKIMASWGQGKGGEQETIAMQEIKIKTQKQTKNTSKDKQTKKISKQKSQRDKSAEIINNKPTKKNNKQTKQEKQSKQNNISEKQEETKEESKDSVSFSKLIQYPKKEKNKAKNKKDQLEIQQTKEQQQQEVLNTKKNTGKNNKKQKQNQSVDRIKDKNSKEKTSKDKNSKQKNKKNQKKLKQENQLEVQNQPKVQKPEKKKRKSKKSQQKPNTTTNKSTDKRPNSNETLAKNKKSKKAKSADKNTKQHAETALQLRKRLERNSDFQGYPKRHLEQKFALLSNFKMSFKPTVRIYIVDGYQQNFDVLVMQKFVRTFKLLYAIAKGIPIVSFSWIMDSEYKRQILTTDRYLLDGPAKNVIQTSLGKVKQGYKVFDGLNFFLISDSYHLSIHQIEELVELCGGKIINQISKVKKNSVVITTNEYGHSDLVKLKAVEHCSKIYTVQMIMDSCLKQEINWSTNQVARLS